MKNKNNKRFGQIAKLMKVMLVRARAYYRQEDYWIVDESSPTYRAQALHRVCKKILRFEEA